LRSTNRKKLRYAQRLIRLLRFVSRLPLPLIHALGILAGSLLWLLPNQQRHIAHTNLTLCFPQLRAAGRRRLLRQSLVETGKTMLELGPLWCWPGTRVLQKIRSVSGEHGWQQAFAGNRGAIIVTPHLGAWEVAGLYIASRYPLTAMYRPSRLGATLDEFIKHARERLGGQYVPAETGGVRAVFQALRRHEVVGILPDQDPDRDSGMFAPFFAQPAFTMVLVSRLALKYQVPVFLIYAQRLARGHGYALHFEKLPEPIRGADLAASVATLNRAVEQAVRRQPQQYLWTYKRFKKRPPGSSKLYQKPSRR
jgi:KDO2-lipid IV(A) lauroyltransferase